jgi:hypothetical protein
MRSTLLLPVYVQDVRKEVNSLGLRSASGREIPRQSFHNMLRNELYAGWVVGGDLRVKGLHEPIVSQQVFDAVQEVLSGEKPERKPYKKTRDDFPLRQFVVCGKCGRGLTAGYNRGRSKQYPFYFCYTPTCRAVSIRAEDLHLLFRNTGRLRRSRPGNPSAKANGAKFTVFSVATQRSWKKRRGGVGFKKPSGIASFDSCVGVPRSGQGIAAASESMFRALGQ